MTSTKFVLHLKEYVKLTKPRIIELLLITTVPIMIVAKNGLPPLSLMLYTVLGGAMAAGGANVFNMYLDRDIDTIMERTKNRPLPRGAVTAGEAVWLGLVLETAAFMLLWLTVNLLSAVLSLGAGLFYVLVYTLLLKRHSAQNIVIGGAAGAVPALVGWAAVDDKLSLAALMAFAIVFFWTPVHFWALAIRYKDDYSLANIPMLPVHSSILATTVQMAVYALLTWASSIAFGVMAHLGLIYFLTALVLGALLTAYSLVGIYRCSARFAMRLFGYSITYLTLLFVQMAVDVFIKIRPL
ncbi:MAG: heme o synthase [Actinobacteria bacterium]|nr:heme o synthase [Actinomycetota bacterium]MCL6105647.1 heme o synthase [Actinomycetota bacterium]